MQAYFSGTDNSELRDNVDKYDYYLSLIVNHVGEYCAKIAYNETIEPTEAWFKFGGKRKKRTTEPFKVYREIEVDIKIENNLPKWFSERVETIKKLKKEEEKKKSFQVSGYGKHENYYSGYANAWGEDSPTSSFSKPKQTKKGEQNLFSKKVLDDLVKKQELPEPSDLEVKTTVLKWLAQDHNFEGNIKDLEDTQKKILDRPASSSLAEVYIDALYENIDEYICSNYITETIEEIPEPILNRFAEKAAELTEEITKDWKKSDEISSAWFQFQSEETMKINT